jgi:hypothetical protein
MNISKYFKPFYLLLFWGLGCMKFTNRDRMLLTSHRIIASIKDDEYSDFRSFIGPELHVLCKDESFVQDDFEKIKRIFKADAEKGYLAITFPGLYNSMGQRVVDIAVDSLHRTLPPDSIYHLALFFGPPGVYTLNKITGYELIRGNHIPPGFKSDSANGRSRK